MKSLSCLPNLSSLQVQMSLTKGQSDNDGLSQFLQDVTFVRRMGQPPLLRTVYAVVERLLPSMTRDCWIWKWCDLEWRGQVVSEWTNWELMHGEV
jgi:hypothetical protein